MFGIIVIKVFLERFNQTLLSSLRRLPQSITNLVGFQLCNSIIESAWLLIIGSRYIILHVRGTSIGLTNGVGLSNSSSPFKATLGLIGCYF